MKAFVKWWTEPYWSVLETAILLGVAQALTPGFIGMISMLGVMFLVATVNYLIFKWSES